jgi:hypothetical protein
MSRGRLHVWSHARQPMAGEALRADHASTWAARFHLAADRFTRRTPRISTLARGTGIDPSAQHGRGLRLSSDVLAHRDFPPRGPAGSRALRPHLER